MIPAVPALRPPPVSVPGVGKVVGAAVTALACAVVVLVLHHVFVTTLTGQVLDDATLVGGKIGRRYVPTAVGSVLDVVSEAGVVASVVLVLVIGIVRRRPWRAALAAMLVVGPSVTTQLLKHVVLSRPELMVGAAGSVDNSLPSGHTTFAGAVSAGVLVVLPPRARPLGALLAALYTATTGVATVVAGWHRASDVVAAIAVVGVWLGLAGAVVAWRNRVAPQPEVDPRAVSGWRLAVPVLLVIAVVGAVAAAGSLVLLASQVSGGEAFTRRDDLALAYAGGAAGICSVSAAVFLAGLAVLRPSRRRARRALGVAPAVGASAPPPSR